MTSSLKIFYHILNVGCSLNYNIFDFQAAGGSKAYSYSVSDSELATIDNEGKLDTHGGPGELRVKAFMPKSPDNHFESRVS